MRRGTVGILKMFFPITTFPPFSQIPFLKVLEGFGELLFKKFPKEKFPKKGTPMQEDEKRRAGLLFFPGDPALVAQKRKAHKASQDFNRLYEDQIEERNAILHEILGAFGEGSFIQGPVTFHYGCHTFIGHHCFVNFNFTVQDDGEVRIGNHCDFGPNVTIVTPVHPMLANERLALTDNEGRSRRLCYAKPVTVGNYCWLGAGVILCPGVTVGDNCVIGAGSVVTRDIPAGSFAAGNPCRVIRTLTDADSIFHKPEVLGDFLTPPDDPGDDPKT